MSYLMLFATGSMQTQNDKMLLGDMNGQTNAGSIGPSLPANCLRTDDYICSTLFRRTCLSWHFQRNII